MARTALINTASNPTQLNTQSASNLTVSEAIRYFSASLAKPGNYPRIARAYLEYCLEHAYSIDSISFKLYAVGQTGNRISPLRKFLLWHQIQGQPVIRADDAKQRQSIPAADSLILQFMADPEVNLVDSSKETYLRILNNFFKFIFQRRTDGQPAGFDAHTVREFLNSPAQQRSLIKNKRSISAFTFNVYLSAIKQLAQWVIDHPEDQNLQLDQVKALQKITRLKGKKIPKGVYKDSLEANERDEVLAQINTPEERAIVALMAWGGLRTIEVVRLHREDIDFKRKRLWILGKGKHVKEAIKLPTLCAKILEQYLLTLPNQAMSTPLFLALTTRAIRYKVSKYLQETGLARPKLSAHSLRHTAAQRLLDDGIEPTDVQRHLRHQNFETTQGYVRKKTDEDYFEKEF